MVHISSVRLICDDFDDLDVLTLMTAAKSDLKVAGFSWQVANFDWREGNLIDRWKLTFEWGNSILEQSVTAIKFPWWWFLTFHLFLILKLHSFTLSSHLYYHHIYIIFTLLLHYYDQLELWIKKLNLKAVSTLPYP